MIEPTSAEAYGVLLAAMIGYWINQWNDNRKLNKRLDKRDEQYGETLDEVHAEVRNDHTSNLRDDVDAVLNSVQDLTHATREGNIMLDQISVDLSTERRRSMRFDEYLLARLNQLDPPSDQSLPSQYGHPPPRR